MKAQTKKEERIDIRVAPEDKKLFLEAQRLSGDKTITSFVVRILKARATEIVEKVLVCEFLFCFVCGVLVFNSQFIEPTWFFVSLNFFCT